MERVSAETAFSLSVSFLLIFSQIRTTSVGAGLPLPTYPAALPFPLFASAMVGVLGLAIGRCGLELGRRRWRVGASAMAQGGGGTVDSWRSGEMFEKYRISIRPRDLNADRTKVSKVLNLEIKTILLYLMPSYLNLTG